MERDDVFADDPDERSPLALDQETLLNDQFRVGRVLGVGGFGITYLAFDEVLEMVVAVKEYLPSDIAVRKSDGDTVQPYTSTGENQDFQFGLERFLQEARTLAKFESHPNIVRVRNFFQANGTGYLVMNFYEGRTLGEYLEARNGFLPEQEALFVMEQVTEGLSAVHDQNVLHRDIDPNNVYLADNGTVVLLDFGAARTAVGERTQSMSVVLKRGYAPHEQYHSHGDQGPWTDVYACSATLYRTLTGYKPPEAAARILDDDLVAPKELVPSLSDATNDAILEGLTVRPADRPQSMDEFMPMLPDPPEEAEPGWIGEVTTTEASGGTAGTSGEIEVTATHSCRLYVDGTQTAALTPNEAYTIGIETGSHRLRAVRTDQADSGNATVTSAGTSVDDDEGGSRMTLDALVWQDVVSVPLNSSLVINIDFDKASGIPATDNTETVADPGAPSPASEEDTAVPEADTVVPDEAPAPPEDADGGSPEQESPSTAPDSASPASESEEEQEAPAAATSAESPSFSERMTEAISGGRAAVQDVLPSWQAVTDVGRVLVSRSRSLGAGVWEWGQAAMSWGGAPTASEASHRLSVYGGAALAGLVLLLGIGWWIASEKGGARSPLEASSVPVVTTTDEAVFDAVAKHEATGTADVQLAGVGPVPDSAVQATAVDSARLRVRPAGGFAGTVRVPYELVEGDSDSLQEGPPDSIQTAVRVRVPFGRKGRRVASAVERPQALQVDSIGGDNALDVVVAALGGNSVTWNESIYTNDTGFGASVPIETNADGVVDVTTADLSGNARPDVVATSLKDDLVAWYENRADSTFSERRTIDASADGAGTVETTDIDGDGLPDVVVGTVLGETLAWYKNEGRGTFGKKRIITEGLGGLEALHVADLNRNGRPEVLAVSYQETGIHRYEPTDSTADSLQVVQQDPIGDDLDEPIEVHTADVIGDDREDLLVGTVGTNSLLLFENRTGQDGEQPFGPKRVLASDLRTIESIDTGDLDQDGDQDIVVAAFNSDTVAWLENNANRSFEAPEPVVDDLPNVISIGVADLDNDGVPDVIAASQADNTVDWYENHLSADDK